MSSHTAAELPEILLPADGLKNECSKKKDKEKQNGRKRICHSLEATQTKHFMHFPTSVMQQYMWGEQPTARKKSTLYDQDSKTTIKFRICIDCFQTVLQQRVLINLSAAYFFNLLLHLLNNESSFKKNFLITPSLQNTTFHLSIKTIIWFQVNNEPLC